MALRRVGALVAVLVVAAGAFLAVTAVFGDDEAPDRPVATQKATPSATAEPGPEGPRASARVRSIAARLSLAERVAQVFMVGIEGSDPSAPVFAELARRPWGAVIVGPENVPPPAVGTLGLLTAQFAVSDLGGNPPPLLVADDLPALPRQPQLNRPAEAREAARSAGAELAAAGIDAVLAPTADLAVPAGPAGKTGFSDDIATVGRLAAAAVRGWLEAGVLPFVGHFPGEGAASQSPIEGPAIVGAAPETDAFRPALARAPAVVVSNATYLVYDSVTPAALLPAVTRDLLRRDIGFRGAVVADDLAGAAAATGGTIGAAAVEALRVGVDLVTVRDPGERAAAYAAVLKAAKAGELPEERLREAVLRVLILKESADRLAPAPPAGVTAP